MCCYYGYYIITVTTTAINITTTTSTTAAATAATAATAAITTTTTRGEILVLNSEIYEVNARDRCNIALNFSTRREQFPRLRFWPFYPRKKKNPVPNEQAVGGPLRRSERGEIIIIIIVIIIINFENCNL